MTYAPSHFGSNINRLPVSMSPQLRGAFAFEMDELIPTEFELDALRKQKDAEEADLAMVLRSCGLNDVADKLPYLEDSFEDEMSFFQRTRPDYDNEELYYRNDFSHDKIVDWCGHGCHWEDIPSIHCEHHGKIYDVKMWRSIHTEPIPTPSEVYDDYQYGPLSYGDYSDYFDYDDDNSFYVWAVDRYVPCSEEEFTSLGSFVAGDECNLLDWECELLCSHERKTDVVEPEPLKINLDNMLAEDHEMQKLRHSRRFNGKVSKYLRRDASVKLRGRFGYDHRKYEGNHMLYTPRETYFNMKHQLGRYAVD